jgi:hypothetical protein
LFLFLFYFIYFELVFWGNTQLLVHGRWFSPASSTTKTGRHDIAEILFITNVQYAVIFATLQEMDCPLYATLEDVLHNCMPAVIIPKKWANVTYLLHIYYIFDRSK